MQLLRRISRRFFFDLMYRFGSPPWDTGISPPELIDFIENHPPGRALDMGCGTGTNAITLAEHGWRVTGVDFSAKAIQVARNKAGQAGVEIDFRVGDVSRLEDAGGPFDLNLDIGCFHGLPEERRRPYLENVIRFLAPGGTYLLYVFFRDPGSTGAGIDQEDLDRIAGRLEQVDRQDGTERGIRPSAWLTFKKTTRKA